MRRCECEKVLDTCILGLPHLLFYSMSHVSCLCLMSNKVFFISFFLLVVLMKVILKMRIGAAIQMAIEAIDAIDANVKRSSTLL